MISSESNKNDPFPLTPTLSLGEREKLWTARGRLAERGSLPRWDFRYILPLAFRIHFVLQSKRRHGFHFVQRIL